METGIPGKVLWRRGSKASVVTNEAVSGPAAAAAAAESPLCAAAASSSSCDPH